jgi:O-acetyl-ADP-ribose deacetylase (regulator of RNase III)
MDRYEDVKNFMPINFGDVVIVEEVGFHCKMVLYVIGLTEDGEPKKGGVPLLQKIITNSLVLATKERANSISISAIGSMLDGVTAEECAVTTLNTVEKFLKSCNKSIQEIHFVNEEEETSIAFAGELCAKHQAFEIPISDLDIESDDEHDPLNQYSDYDFEKPDSDDECCQAVFDVLLGKEVQRIDTEF